MNTKQLQTTKHELDLAWKRAYKHGGTAENNDILVAIEAAQTAVQAKLDQITKELEAEWQAGALDNLLAENNLTENEYKVLELSLNYTDREGQLCDNYSNFDTQAAMEVLSFNAQQVGGVVSSLCKKGYMMDDEDMVWLTDNGVNAVFNVLEVA